MNNDIFWREHSRSVYWHQDLILNSYIVFPRPPRNRRFPLTKVSSLFPSRLLQFPSRRSSTWKRRSTSRSSCRLICLRPSPETSWPSRNRNVPRWLLLRPRARRAARAWGCLRWPGPSGTRPRHAGTSEHGTAPFRESGAKSSTCLASAAVISGFLWTGSSLHGWNLGEHSSALRECLLNSDYSSVVVYGREHGRILCGLWWDCAVNR